MGRALLSDFLHDLCGLLSSQLNSNSSGAKRDIYAEFRAELLILDGVVDDAEHKQFKEEVGAQQFKQWLNDLQDAAYGLEDLLLQIQTTIKSSPLRGRQLLTVFSKTAKPIKTTIKSLPPRGRQLFTVFSKTKKPKKYHINDHIREVRGRLTGLVLKKDVLVLTARDTQSEYLPGFPSSSAVLNNYFYGKYPKDCFYGRDEEEKSILENLLSTSEDFKVINIVGEDGVGKTTLADAIYFHHKVRESFKLRAWVTVSDKASSTSVANKILEAVTGDFVPDNDFFALRKRLRASFAGKKFLLVLDDIRIEDSELIISCFESAARGSGVILTSSPHDDPELLEPLASHTVHLESLSMENSWLIFLAHASGQIDLHEELELAKVGKRIVNKLGNLPLATKMIGSLLQDKLKLAQWLDILSKLPNAGDVNLPISSFRVSLDADDVNCRIPLFLVLCYLDLPAQIKRCFAYLSLFPKGYQFKQKEVVLLWMAEGFLKKRPDSESKSNGKSMEDIGDEYLGYLIMRSFLQPLGSGASFVMHDLVHDLATYVLGDSYKHHLSFSASTKDFLDLLLSTQAETLRTILSFQQATDRLVDLYLIEMMCSRKVLRVLSFSRCYVIDLPDSIGRLNYLCYLDLSHTALQKLPDSICYLLNLQTLLLAYCLSLTSLPKRICNLINLRYLDIRGSGVQEMPSQVHKLTSLRTLTHFIVSRNGSRFGELARLSNLKTLTISKLQNVAYAKDASDAKLKEKKSLDDLVLQWVDHDCSGDVIEVLENLEPPKDLKRLTIEYYSGARFPDWLGHPSYWSLQSVALRDCRNCNSLPTLGLLPRLKDLLVEGFTVVTCIGSEFCGEMTASQKPFQSLESLQFRDMSKWTKWDVLEGIEFPRLIKLCIVQCPSLQGDLPKQLLSLRKLEIIECNDLKASLPKVSNTCEVFVDEGGKHLMSYDVKTHSQPSMRRVTVSEEAHEFTSRSQSGKQILGSSLSEIEEINPELPLDDSPLSEKATVPKPEQPTDISLLLGETSTAITTQEAVAPLTPTTPAPVQEEPLSKEDLDDQPSSFEVLRVSTVSQLNSLPPKLHGLKIEGCESLKGLPDDSLGGMTTLKELYLISCSSLESVHYPGSLTTLYICNCRRLKFLPSLESKKKLASLHHLFIGSGCDSLELLALDSFTQLKTLCIWDCPKFHSFDVIRGPSPSLESLEIRDCPRFTFFLEAKLHAPNLASILLSNCQNLKKLPDAMNSLISLKTLFLHRCPQIKSFPPGGLPSSLVFLSIAYCDNLKDWNLFSLESLHHFELEGGCEDMESFPRDKLLPRSIKTLHISSLKSLEKLDDKGFQHLNALQTLEIHCCDMLESLPDDGLPCSLDRLSVEECPLLTPRLEPMTGDEWHKVAHVPHIQIDDQVLS